MADDVLKNGIDRFYKVCLFGNYKDDYGAAANRAYRDLCRTINFKDKDDKKHCEYRSGIVGLIVEKIQEHLLKCQEPNQGIYDAFHRELCGLITNYENEIAALTYGQAQKWVNMTMKYLCVLSDANFTGDYKWLGDFYPYLHVPIDSIILNKIAEARFPNFNLDKNISWSKIDKYEFYLEIQKNLRESLTAMSPMDWEFEVWG